MGNVKKLLIFIGVILISGVLIFFAVRNIGTNQSDADGIPKNAIPVQVALAATDTIISKVKTKGTVELNSKEVISAETQAKVLEVSVKLGDFVSEGQVLVKYDPKSKEPLDDALAEAKVALKIAELGLSSALIPISSTEIVQAQAQVTQAEQLVLDAQDSVQQIVVSLEQANRALVEANNDYDTNLVLFEQGVISQFELEKFKDAITALTDQIENLESQKITAQRAIDKAQNSVDVATSQLNATLDKENDPRVKNQIAQQQTQVEQTRLKIRQIEKQLSDFKLEEVSPIAGTVIGLYAENGSVVTPGQMMLTIADVNNLVIKTYVSEFDAPSVAVGQKVELTGDALGDMTYSGEVTSVSPIASLKTISNSNEVVVEVEIAITDKDTILKPGYSMEAEIITNIDENTVVVPIMATLSDKDGSQFVYIVKDDYSVEKRTIKIKNYSDLVVSVDGVNENEQIISSPSAQIKEGVFVKPILSASEE